MPPKSKSGAASTTSNEQSPQQQLDLNTLSAQQLSQVKKQLDDELSHLNSSFTSLRGAQSRFAECVRSIDAGVAGLDEGADILVPLTTSLYVPGKLADRERVIVDVGTGFLVEMVRTSREMYSAIRRANEVLEYKGCYRVLRGQN